jgi:Holliday junction resolvasome RuvABC ATP-dependent DNA helicase subunit
VGIFKSFKLSTKVRQAKLIYSFFSEIKENIRFLGAETNEIVNRLLKRVRDFSTVLGHEEITFEDTKLALNRLEIVSLGLDAIDKKILESIIVKFNGGPVGLDTLSATVNEEANTVEDVYEPYLLQLGFIARTTRGRVCLKKAYDHLKIPYNKGDYYQPSLFDINDV